MKLFSVNFFQQLSEWRPPVSLLPGRTKTKGEEEAPYQHLALQLSYEQRRPTDTRAALLISPDSTTRIAQSSLLLARNLAQVLRKRVLLVELSSESPEIACLLGCPQRRGLFEFLADPTLSLDELVVGTTADNVAFLPAGSNRSVLTNAPTTSHDVVNIRALLQAARETFDFTLLYGGSLLEDSMALAVAPHVGRVLLASIENETRLSDLEAVQKSLELCRVKNLAQLLIRSPR